MSVARKQENEEVPRKDDEELIKFPSVKSENVHVYVFKQM